MNPEEALQVLDLASRLAPLSYEDQVRRCAAVDVLKKAIEPADEKQKEPSAEVTTRPVKGAKK